MAVALLDVAGRLIEGLGNGGKIIRRLVSDIDLVGPVLQNVFPAAQMRGQLLEVVAVGVDDHFGRLGRAVVQHHVGNMAENVACAFNNTFHRASNLFPLFFILMFQGEDPCRLQGRRRRGSPGRTSRKKSHAQGGEQTAPRLFMAVV